MVVDWEAYWSRYDTCWRCGSRAGERCKNLLSKGKSCWVAHKQRKRR